MAILYVILAVIAGAILRAFVPVIVALPLFVVGAGIVWQRHLAEREKPDLAAERSVIAGVAALVALVAGVALAGHVLGIFFDGAASDGTTGVGLGGPYREY